MSTEVITLRVLSPIILHERRASEQFAPTLDYLPGSSMRGAVANLYLSGNSKLVEESCFKRLFLNGETRFSDFLPVPPRTSGLSQLIPLSAVSCKRFSEHFEKSLSDSLLWMEWLGEREGETIPGGGSWPAPSRMAAYKNWMECPVCLNIGLEGSRERVEPGYIHSLTDRQPILVRRRMQSGTSINRKTGTAASGMLFSHEVIVESDPFNVERSVLFRGIVSISDEMREKLLDLLPLGQELFIGYGRSRGWGLITVESIDTASQPRLTLVERWEKLNEAALRLWESDNAKPNGQYFSLTLQSHLILLDETGRPVLGNLCPVDFGFPKYAELRRVIQRSTTITGWNTAGNRPKNDRLAIARGSVFLFRIPPEYETGPVLKRLEEIERDGIGELREDGLGRVSACDPFHFTFLKNELKG